MRVSVLGYSPIVAFIVQGLAKEGHQITYIAPDADGHDAIFYPDWQEAIETVTGVGSLMDTLRLSKIEQSQVFLAMSNNDNWNAMAAQMAQKLFNVPKVVCLVQDPERVEMYERMGLTTASPAATVAKVVEEVLRS
jgi:trk system potassium uptake protein TrkA